MKIRILLAGLIGSACLAGCQALPPPTDAQMNEIVNDAARDRNWFTPTEEVCRRDSQLSESITYDLNVAYQMCVERLSRIPTFEQRQQAEAQQKQQNLSRRVAEIRAGRASIQTAEEAKVFYHASDSFSIMDRPLIRPDGRNYIVYGEIDSSDGLQGNNLLIKLNLPMPLYITITGVDIPTNARVGSFVVVVGSYSGNREYMTLAGKIKVMPVLTSRFIKLIN